MHTHFQVWEFGYREVEGMENVQKPKEWENMSKTLKKSRGGREESYEMRLERQAGTLLYSIFDFKDPEKKIMSINFVSSLP